jgi:ribosomal protein S27AE
VSHDHDHGGAHDHEDEEEIDISEWARRAERRTCPACGAGGALPLGGGVFCPTCGQVTTNPGYEAPPTTE